MAIRVSTTGNPDGARKQEEQAVAISLKKIQPASWKEQRLKIRLGVGKQGD